VAKQAERRSPDSLSALDEFLTVAEIAELLKLDPQTVRNWIDAATLPTVHIGRRVRIRRGTSSGWSTRATPGDVARPSESPTSSIWDGEIPPPAVP
jgi:excisionase family DNA binding protein